MMHKPLSEEQELLNELKKQERQWRILRWFLPVLAIWMLFDPVRFFQGSPLIGTLLIVLAVGRWHGDPKSKLLIKLCEEKIEREFIEEEIEKSRKIAVQEKKIEDFLEKQFQQP
jgi:hypothetical protein